MRGAKGVSQVVKIRWPRSNRIRIAQPVFVTHNNAAAEAEVPGEKGIHIKEVIVLILVFNKWSFQVCTIGRCKKKAVVAYFVPVVPCTQRKVKPWRKVVDAGQQGGGLQVAPVPDHRLAVGFADKGIANLGLVVFAVDRQAQGKPIAETVPDAGTGQIVITAFYLGAGIAKAIIDK